MKLQIIIWSCVSSYINLFVGLKTPISKFIDIGGSFAGVFICLNATWCPAYDAARW